MLVGAEAVGERYAEGEPYTQVETGPVVRVRVLAGAGRHGSLTVTRLR
ncbi:hypothetical protein [Streptomyces sp. NPDC052042]